MVVRRTTEEQPLHKEAPIYVAGGDTLLGAALLERLRASGHWKLVGIPPDEPDLTHAGQVEDFFAAARPEYVFLAAGKSGGIEANQRYPAELMIDNLLTVSHVFRAAWDFGVKKLLYLGSSCFYPTNAPQPLREESLLTGPLEPTSTPYAVAKLAGLTLCQAYRKQHGAPFICAIPTNSFGPGDDFGANTAHVIPALIRKLHQAKVEAASEVVLWGSGRPRREFLFSQDLADACLSVMAHYDGDEPINLAGGKEMTIAELAEAVAEVVGYRGRIRFDPSRPDGAARKVLDSTRLRSLSWQPATDFFAALRQTYSWFLEHLVTEAHRHVCAAL
jgi:GDP-L-fucose synthase